MTPDLYALVGGLALVDSLNPATIVTVTLILISSMQHRVLAALLFVAAAATTVLTVGFVIYFSSSAAVGNLDGGLDWLRRIAFTFAAVALAFASIKRLSDRPRRAPNLPTWFTPWTAFPLGVVVTGADLPNAFPYFIAIERLVSAEVSPVSAVTVLGVYAVIYCIPCLVLLAVGVTLHDRISPRLDALRRRLGTGTTSRNPWVAVVLALLAAAAIAIGWV